VPPADVVTVALINDLMAQLHVVIITPKDRQLPLAGTLRPNGRRFVVSRCASSLRRR